MSVNILIQGHKNINYNLCALKLFIDFLWRT